MAERLMKTVFDWEHFVVYLAGPMDFADDGGTGWRDEWTKKLIDIGIGQKQIFNPCKKPFNGVQFDLDDEARIWQECRDEKDWDRMEKIASQIMHIDLRLVEKSDIVLVNFPRMDNGFRVPTYGTIHEIVVANQQKKPIFIVWEETGKSDCSAWLMKLVGHKNIFTHEDELIEHLHSISQGEKSFDANKWLLIDPK
jgi:nucleoside 2-deoxyribosyltransferase